MLSDVSIQPQAGAPDRIEVRAMVAGVPCTTSVLADDLHRRVGPLGTADAVAVAAKVFSDKLTDYKFLLQAIDVKLRQCDKLGVDRFFGDEGDMNRLNPYFGFPTGLSNRGFNARGVSSVWAGAESERLSVNLFPRGYGGDRVTIHGFCMNDRQLRGIWTLLDDKCRERQQQLDKAAANKSIDEYWPQIKAWAERCVEHVQDVFAVRLQTGKRAYDSQEYKALVFFQNEGGKCDANSQLGHIPVWQDADGEVWYKWCKPLGGETGDMRLPMQEPQEWQQQIKKAVEHILGFSIVVRERTEREKRISDISVYPRTYGGQRSLDYFIRCRIDGIQQSGRLIGKEATSLHNLIYNRQHGYIAELKLELAQSYFKDVLDVPKQSQDRGIKR